MVPYCDTKLTQSDPWAAHLVGGEQDAVITEVPKLCPAYCQSVYSACKDATLNSSFPPFFVSKLGKLFLVLTKRYCIS